MGQVHGISKVLRSRNNAKGTCQVGADENNFSSSPKGDKRASGCQIPVVWLSASGLAIWAEDGMMMLLNYLTPFISKERSSCILLYFFGDG